MTSVTWKCYWKTGALTYPECEGGRGLHALRREGGHSVTGGVMDWLAPVNEIGAPGSSGGWEPHPDVQQLTPSLFSWSPCHLYICRDFMRHFTAVPASAWGNNIIFSSLLSCSILWDASCKNSFYVARSTWLLLRSTNQHRLASLSRRPLLWM